MKVVVTRTFKNIVKMRYDDGKLEVLANWFVTQKKMRQIISENADWINSCREKNKTSATEKNIGAESSISNDVKQTRIFDYNDSRLISDMFSGRKILLLGDIVSVTQSLSSKTYLDGGALYISEKYYNQKAERLKAIKAYLKKIAALYVASEVASFGSGVSLCPVKIEFKDIKDSWIKCSLASQKILNIDYRITQLPQNLRIYIIAHAFAHFYNPAHDENFWNYMSNILPRYQDCLTELQKYEFLKDI